MRKNIDQKNFLDSVAQSKYNYWFSFVSDATLFVALITYGVFIAFFVLLDIMFFVAGFFLLGLIEYAVHRWVFHNPKTPAFQKHMQHHGDPKRLLALPWFVSTSTLVCLWGLFCLLIGREFASFLVAGMVLGYLYYGLVHHLQHQLPGFWKKRTAYHEIHHKHPNINYGVTTSFWDVVFRTKK